MGEKLIVHAQGTYVREPKDSYAHKALTYGHQKFVLFIIDTYGHALTSKMCKSENLEDILTFVLR